MLDRIVDDIHLHDGSPTHCMRPFRWTAASENMDIGPDGLGRLDNYIPPPLRYRRKVHTWLDVL